MELINALIDLNRDSGLSSETVWEREIICSDDELREDVGQQKQYIENMEHNNEYIDYPDYSQLQYRCQEACTVYVSARPEEKQQIFF